MSRLKIKECFFSLQGETSLVGLPTWFIRLTGCPLRCSYCDSEYAFTGGTLQLIQTLVTQAKTNGLGLVCVTGGEPLAQPACFELLTALCDAGQQVSLETSGAIDTTAVDARVKVILDLKTPSSQESARNMWSNLQHLKPTDEVKFVIGDRLDYDWAKQVIKQQLAGLKLNLGGCIVSPVYGRLSATTLADWVIADRLPVRMQTQMHKQLWGDEPGR